MKILELETEKSRLGRYGERIAARYLRRHGYKILEKNFVANNHEIDIIAESCDTVAFIEVKTRTLSKQSPNEPRPASAVNAKKQRAIISAAKSYIGFNRTGKKKRLDIVEVLVNDNKWRYSLAEIKHLQNAFNINTAFDKQNRS